MKRSIRALLLKPKYVNEKWRCGTILQVSGRTARRRKIGCEVVRNMSITEMLPQLKIRKF